MSVAPENVIRVTPPTGSDHSLAINRDHTTGVGLLTSGDMSVTTSGRLGIWMGHTMIVGAPADHGEVADEAAMLALHDWADDPHTRAAYHYVAPGDSCTRTDDPGYRWFCLHGHGTAGWQWERRPLGATVAQLREDVDALDTALDGKQPIASALTALSGVDVSDVGLALLALDPPAEAMVPQIEPDGSISYISPGSDGTTLPTPTVGQMLYCTAAGTWAALPAPGVVGQVLTATESGGSRIPQWVLPAQPYQERVQKWNAWMTILGASLTPSSLNIAETAIAAMNLRSWAGKVLFWAPLLGADILAARVPLVDQRGKGPMINTGFVNADFSESTGLQGGAGKGMSTQMLINTDLGANRNGSLLGWINAVGTVIPRAIVGNVSGYWYGGGAGIYPTPTTAIADWGQYSSSRISVARTITAGCYHLRRSSTTSRTLFVNGSAIGSSSDVDDNSVAIPVRLLADEYEGLRGCDHRLATAMILDGTETDAEVADIYAFLGQYLITPTGR